MLLINEQSLSDAGMAGEGFKTLKPGAVVRNKTYHWIIFILGPGGWLFYPPAFLECYSLDGRDFEKTGMAPAVKIDQKF